MSFVNGGMILVLFILLVIVTSFVYSPSQRNNPQDNESITIQGSKGFNIYNRTANFTLVSSSFDGEFEAPFPSAHIILPNRSHHFEVIWNPFRTYTAYVTYNVLSETDTVGNIRIKMSTTGPFDVRPSTEIQSINGPIRYENGGTYVTIFNS
ncbi:hypothetical protein [Paenibacillus herberti]|uniref:Uncharacterized protein n=1 Tax=Paenibacillus herberti TaxID=1619309 RepID=A0A229P2Z0_9BACL|nr:hypothetical protein [Paenibacillus herberti]OXM16488.1 hypothetical protein CGZ75_07390 [Paenibacillus herberti]